MKALFIVVRVVGAIAIVAAIVAQLERSIQVWNSAGVSVGPQVTNFFSFFTIDSNVLTVVAFAIGAVALIRGRPDRRGWALFRVSVFTYMATTGIVYNLLLRGVALPQGTTVEWSNEVLHVVGPVLAVLDWLLAPGRMRLEWKDIRVIVVFPLVWVIYTMVRGPFAGDELRHVSYWYPYPFLNPNLTSAGYASVALYIALITVVIGGVGALGILASRRGRGREPLQA